MTPKQINQFTIYSRKSKFTGKGESIENQIELCKQYIYTHFPGVTEKDILIYEDEGFSGGNIERPQFKNMMNDARAGKFSTIVCYRLDRISRNIGDFAKLIEELDTLQIAFVSIKEQFDTSSPMGRAMMYISSVFSQLERETIAERIRDNMHELSKTGRWLGGTSPTGYISESVENVTVDGKVKKACKLKLLPDEADIVRLIFAKFLETGSLTKTETFLIQNDRITKRGNLFTRFALKNILTNPVYMIADKDAYKYLKEKQVDLFANESDFDGKHGIMAYNRTIQKPGRAHQIKPEDEWIVSVGRHVGLIRGTDWIKVQESLERNKSKSYRRPRSNTALLSGVLFCGDCGDYMRPKLTQRTNAQGELIYTYLCSLKEKSCGHSCKIKNVNGNILDKMVIEEIKKLSEDSSEFIRQLESAKDKILANRDAYDEDIDRLRKSAEENEKEITALVVSLSKAGGGAAEDYIIKQIEKLHDKNESLKLQISQLEGLTSEHVLSDIEFNLLCQTLSNFKATFDSMGIEQKRSALRSFVKKVIWDGKNVHLYIFGAEEEICVPSGEYSE